MREKMGAIYGGGFRGSVVKEPYQHFSIQMQLPCGPENVDKLLAAADTEIRKLIEKGPEQKDVEKVKSQWREKYITAVKKNEFWLEKMEMVLYWGRDKDRVLKYESYVDKLSAKDVQAAAKELLSGKNKFVAVLYPES